ncbi:hypothetical protein AD006_18530 [Pseudonocardia sp. EC080610-09]|uniref:FUSC family protein n=1 Tax=unclassified Pseudonocardia TaxID=2619320 RepID=UPI0006CB2678|nr:MULTISPECIES: FUSC family protein [unclassified Pseudonocardia]ALE73661.1 hypothetical protein FRP1_12455 [Pseudonocardia sp. EC080625-04]ALL76809.1 hypothetical protein AD006_18530 [Pseudonocardia sp. EC080610-09]ALL83838.1 hypothetical protein AD017_26360 [Pseudonocardia sp. EC080619-01]
MSGWTSGRRPAWWAELRSRAAAVDPGHTRLHLASVATASMMTAALVMSGLRALTGQPVTIVLFAVVLAMVGNLAVNEPELRRRRVTTALMVLPACASATLSALLSGHRVVADVVFVLVMIVAVAVRRWGPRGVALGMAAFMPYFFVQFLQAGPAQLPYLLAGAVVGIGSTFLLRCVVFTRRVEVVLEALVRSFEARLHVLLLAAVDVLDEPGGLADPDLDPLLRAQARLNATALAVADRLDDADDDPAARRPVYLPGGARPGGPDDAETEIAGLRQWIVDSELAAERVAMSIRRTVEHHDPIPGPDREALAAGVRALAAATAVGTPRAIAARLYQEAREAVGEIVGRPGGTGAEAREQRIGFAVLRLADAVQSTIEEAWRGIARRRDAPGEDPSDDDTGGAGLQGGPELHTRQAVQVGVATSLAIVVGELISPARWYWAVIAAFVVFAGTASRGDVLSRGWARAVGTAGGVVAGMLLALLVAGNLVASLLLLFACVFLALYLVRISQAMMAFWITAVLALLYGVIGQFSVETMLLRVEETVVGGALGMLAAYLILPTRSRTAFAEALDDALTAVDVSLRCSVDRALGRPGENPLEKAREVDEAVATVRERARPLEHPVARRPLRRGVHHTARVVGALDHYTRLLAAQAAVAHVPEWATTLDPATDRVRRNVDGLRRILVDGWGPAARREHAPGTSPADYGVGSAEDLIDAAEADAASSGPATGRTGGAVDPFGALPAGHGATDTAGWVAPADPRTRDSAAGAPPGDRLRRLAAARLLRRIDQLAVGLARELSGGTRHEAPEPRTGTDGIRSGPG